MKTLIVLTLCLLHFHGIIAAEKLLLEIKKTEWHLTIHTSSKNIESRGSSDINIYIEGNKLPKTMEDLLKMAKSNMLSSVEEKSMPIKRKVALRLQLTGLISIEKAAEEAFKAIAEHYELTLAKGTKSISGLRLEIVDKQKLKVFDFQPGTDGVLKKQELNNDELVYWGGTLADLSEALGKKWNRLIWTNEYSEKTFSFMLDVSTVNATKKGLEKYGLSLVEDKMDLPIWEVY